MTTIELETKKTEVYREILDIEDDKILSDVIAYIRRAKTSVTQPPCRYTVKELRNRVAESVEDVKAGRVYTMEEVRAMFSRP
jgi:hypothetical protein